MWEAVIWVGTTTHQATGTEMWKKRFKTLRRARIVTWFMVRWIHLTRRDVSLCNHGCCVADTHWGIREVKYG